jgi:hypothetical protein
MASLQSLCARTLARLLLNPWSVPWSRCWAKLHFEAGEDTLVAWSTGDLIRERCCFFVPEVSRSRCSVLTERYLCWLYGVLSTYSLSFQYLQYERPAVSFPSMGPSALWNNLLGLSCFQVSSFYSTVRCATVGSRGGCSGMRRICSSSSHLTYLTGHQSTIFQDNKQSNSPITRTNQRYWLTWSSEA